MKNLKTILAVAVIAAVTFTSCDPEPQPVKNVPVESVTLNESAYTLVEGKTFQLVAEVLPTTATNKDVTYESDNEAAAIVDEDGLVTAVKAGVGTATITVTADGGETDVCVFTIEAAPVPVTDVELNESTLLFTEENETFTLVATVLPVTATNQNIRWESDNEAVAMVIDGVVTAVANGETTISVITEDGNHKATCEVNVTIPHPLFGIISFRTAKTWIAGTQTWSDVVMVSAARGKTTFNGGNVTKYNVDFRANKADTLGDLFSWEAVNQYPSALCPGEWRVPTKDEFVALDIALGGTGVTYQTDAELVAKYMSDWGADNGGLAYAGGALSQQGKMAYYWSSVESLNKGYIYSLHLSGDRVSPAETNSAANGYTLRCIK